MIERISGRTKVHLLHEDCQGLLFAFWSLLAIGLLKPFISQQVGVDGVGATSRCGTPGMPLWLAVKSASMACAICGEMVGFASLC